MVIVTALTYEPIERGVVSALVAINTFYSAFVNVQQCAALATMRTIKRFVYRPLTEKRISELLNTSSTTILNIYGFEHPVNRFDR